MHHARVYVSGRKARYQVLYYQQIRWEQDRQRSVQMIIELDKDAGWTCYASIGCGLDDRENWEQMEQLDSCLNS